MVQCVNVIGLTLSSNRSTLIRRQGKHEVMSPKVNDLRMFFCLVANRYGTWKLRMWKSTIIETSFHCRGLHVCWHDFARFVLLDEVAMFDSILGWMFVFSIPATALRTARCNPCPGWQRGWGRCNQIKNFPRPNKPIATLMPPLQTGLSHLPLSRKIYVYT